MQGEQEMRQEVCCRLQKKTAGEADTGRERNVLVRQNTAVCCSVQVHREH